MSSVSVGAAHGTLVASWLATMKALITSCLVYGVLLFAACNEGRSEDPQSGADGSAAFADLAAFDAATSDLARNATTIDLSEFRARAQTKLGALGVTDFSGAAIWFVDGAGQIDDPPAFDYARLYYVSPVPATLSPKSNWRLAYYVSLQGFESVQWVWVTATQMNVAGLGGVATFAASATPSQVTAAVNAIHTSFPTATLQVLDAIGVVTFSSSSAADATAIFHQLEAAAGVKVVELDGEVYKIEFKFGKPISLGDGTNEQLVDLITLTSITKMLRAQGVPFTTTPHLPPPF